MSATDNKNPLVISVRAAGSIKKLASFLNLKSVYSVQRMLANGRFPRTDYTGETDYARRISKAYKIPMRELLPPLSPSVEKRDKRRGG